MFGHTMRLNHEVVVRQLVTEMAEKGEVGSRSEEKTKITAKCSQSQNSVSENKGLVKAKMLNRGPYKRGHMVLVKRPGPGHLQGRSQWSGPFQVLDVLGNWTYHLSDGWNWNARRMHRYLPLEDQWVMVEARRPPPEREVPPPPRVSEQ